MAATQNAKDSQPTRFPEVIDVKLPNIRGGGSMRKALQKTQSNAELPVENTPLNKVPMFDRTNSKKADVTDSQRESSPGRIN